jgi:Rod binding domain-containing protein
MLTPIDSSQLPADVRAAGPRGRQIYAAALGFEQALVSQLTQQLAQSAQSSDDDEDGGDAGTSMYKSMLPDALSQGLTASSGVGLADQLFRMLTLGEAGSQAQTDGEAQAPGTGEVTA